MIFIDNSMITSFRRCKQEFMEKWIMNRQSAFISIHQTFGRAVHKAIEMMWFGERWEAALARALEMMRAVDAKVHSSDLKRWEELKDALPDCVAVYADSVSVDEKPLQIEAQFHIEKPFGIEGVTAVGRIDRVHSLSPSRTGDSTGPDVQGNRPTPLPEKNDSGPVSPLPLQSIPPTADSSSLAEDSKNLIAGQLASTPDNGRNSAKDSPVRLIDSKTASEIDDYDVFGKKVGWERSYKERMLLDSGLGMYDWALRQMGMTPAEIQLEVILKPYPRFGKKARLVLIDMPEIIAYRERHDQQLELTLYDMQQWILLHAGKYPWPMTDTACQTKFGWCQFAPICRYGFSPKIQKLYEMREEHLDVKERISK